MTLESNHLLRISLFFVPLEECYKVLVCTTVLSTVQTSLKSGIFGRKTAKMGL